MEPLKEIWDNWWRIKIIDNNGFNFHKNEDILILLI